MRIIPSIVNVTIVRRFVACPLWAQSAAAAASGRSRPTTTTWTTTSAGRSALEAMIRNGRQWLHQSWRFVWRTRFKASPANHQRHGVSVASSRIEAGGLAIVDRPTVAASRFSRRRLPVPNVASKLLSWVSESPAAKLRREAAARLLFGGGGGRRLPIFALVGVTLTSGTDGIVTRSDKMESVCEKIRICAEQCAMDHEDEEEDEDSSIKSEVVRLKDLQLGRVIAKGCNAVVHAARWKNNETNEERLRKNCEEDIKSCCSDLSESGIEVAATTTACGYMSSSNANAKAFGVVNTQKSTVSDICTPFGGYDLAVKMMFNYEAESNAPAIMRAMHKEIVPAKNINDNDKEATQLFQKGEGRKYKLPTHPNIVDMRFLFADTVPDLPHAMTLYPDALPKRLNTNGAGRNMTLFLVMKRYNCSLQQYLEVHRPTERTSFLLLAQLLEGVAHLRRNFVAHRDLKADNILIDLGEGLDYPHLVITDFGCCLADKELRLKLPYHTEETDKGGNSALMAPEVACAKSGPFVIIDYDKADLWTVGALAYEIFGQKNPFYRRNNTSGESAPRLDSRDYRESDLPELADDVHPIVRRLVFEILRRNRRNRPSCTTAANVLNILLFGPKKLVDSYKTIDAADEDDDDGTRTETIDRDVDIVEWLLALTARTVIQRSSIPQSRRKLKRVEQELVTCFLRRVKLDQLSEAVEYFVG